MSEKGRPRSFDRDGALRRAMEVFWARGYDGASLAELTAAMAIRPSSLYAAFGSKQALFKEAAALYDAREGTGIWDALPDTPRVRDAFARFLHASADAFTRSGKPAGCLIVLGALHQDEDNAEAFRDLRRRRAGNLRTLRDRLRRAVAEGELPEGVDCEAVARFYATVQQGMSVQARDGATRKALHAVADAAMAAWEALTGR